MKYSCNPRSDDEALRRESDKARRDYGSALIHALEFDRLPAAQAALLPFISRKSEMKQRLHQIMKNPTYSMLPQIGVALLAMVALIVTFNASASPANAAEENRNKTAEGGKRENPEAAAAKQKDGEAAKTGPKDGDGKKEGEGDKGKGAKEGDKPAAAGANMNKKERGVFDAYDKDSDGFVTAKEMEAMMEGKQNSAGRRDLRKAVDRADKDGDEKLNFEEFLFWYNIGRVGEAENR